MKNALVTGATSGIGFACAQILAKRGCNVILVGRDWDKLEKAHLALQKSGRHVLCQSDIIEKNRLQNGIHNALRDIRQTKLDICVHSAGDSQKNPDTREELRRLIEVNAIGTLNVLEAVIPLMKTGGHIGALSSLGSLVRLKAGVSPYVTSKVAMNEICEGLRAGIEEKGMTLTVAYPAIVDTTMVRNLSKPSVTFRAFKWHEPSKAAQTILRDIEAGRRESYLTLGHRLLVPFARACPFLFAHAIQMFIKARTEQ